MHIGKIKAIEDSISKIIKSYHEKHKINHLDYQFVAICEYNKIKEQLYKEAGFIKKFSERYIYKKLREIVNNLIADKTLSGRTEINRLIKSLENFNIKQTVYLPLSGIKINDPQKKYQLGNISLVSPTEERRSKTLKLIKYILQKNPHHTKEEKDYFFDRFSPTVNKCFKDASALAKYSVIAEPIRAKERAY